MKTLLLKNKSLYLFYALYFLCGAIVLFLINRGDIVIWINQYHTPTLDFFFKYFTKVGEEVFLLPLFFVILYKYRYKAILLLINIVLNGFFVQLLKRLVFSDVMRPSAVLGKESYHLVEGVKLHARYSFPSGHTNTGFAFFVILALLSKQDWLKVLCAIMAILVGLSRVYLFQHFYEDTYVGGMIGVILSTVIYYYIENHTSLKEKLQRK
ncbi:MAG: phosphatase PAP2 family protein [Cytophagales bacterium]|nr:phosphatase PAP2 family protein [Cytophagales bacterium]